MKKTLSGLALTLLAGTAQAQVFVGVDEATLPFLADYDIAANAFFRNVGLNTLTVRAAAEDDANRVVYFSTGTQLWRMPYDAPRTPVFIGSFSGATTGISAGLAWDSNRGLLYGTGGTTSTSTGTRIFTINPATAVTTLVRNFTSPDFAGLDYDPATDSLFASNDSTSTLNGFSGRGIYQLQLPIAAASTFSLVAPYPFSSGTTVETDIDSIAVGGGKIYLPCDERDFMYVYDTTDGVYLTPVSQTPFTTTDEVYSGSFYSTVFHAAVNPNNDILITGSGPADCTVGVGAPGTFNYTIANPAAPVAGVTLTVTLPAGTTGVSSVPAGTLVGNTLTINVGALGAAATTAVTVNAAPGSAGSFAVSATVSHGVADPNLADNTVNLSTNVAPPITATSGHAAVYSTLVNNPSSLVPGMGGLRYASTAGLDRPYRSLNGQYWIQQIDTDNADVNLDEAVIVWNNGTISVVVQEGVTSTGGTIIDLIDPGSTSINDSGVWAISGTLETGTATDGFISRSNGASLDLLIQEGVTLAPADTGALALGDPSSPSIANNGDIVFRSILAGGTVTTTNDSALLRLEGTTIETIAQEGTTVPGGTLVTCKLFDTGSASGGINQSSDGLHFLWSGQINEATVGDEVLVKDSTDVSGQSIVVQEAIALPGGQHPEPAASTTPYNYSYMAPNGDWFAYGAFEQDGSTTTNTVADDDWAMRNGVVLARTGQPITTGSTELWDDTAYGQTFFHIHGNNAGDYVIGGVTNAADLNANAVIVLNGTTVLARENDPVDIDNDGDFDEGVYIQTFNDDEAVLMEDALFLMVELRGHGFYSGCTATDTDAGQAMLRIPLSTGPTCGSADFDGDGDTGTDADIEAFFACLGGNCCGTCGTADFDGDGDTGTDADIEAFFRVLGGGNC